VNHSPVKRDLDDLQELVQTLEKSKAPQWYNRSPFHWIVSPLIVLAATTLLVVLTLFGVAAILLTTIIMGIIFGLTMTSYLIDQLLIRWRTGRWMD
jgi:hypothetical protein